MRLPFVLVLALSSASLGATSQTPSPKTAPAPAWPHQSSDLPADPRIHFGMFVNGMRWAWMDNAEPKNRCYLRLHMNVGSLAEEDSQRGMAHFLEHMAFNGSKHHEPGTLIHWFQKHGMGFGGDTNASTSYSQTIYQLDLPESDEATLREGLEVLRDFADGLSLEQKEIDAEKGVVDAEDREAQSATRRVIEANNRLLFSGTRIPDRDPIGVKSARDAFSSASVRAFYERWYRPENATLILVGDLQGRNPMALFEEAFASWKQPAEPLRREPDIGKADLAHRFYAIYEKEFPAMTVGLQMAKPWHDRKPSRALYLEELPRAVGRRMLNLRFSELQKKTGAPFLGALLLDTHDGAEGAGLRALEGEELVVQSSKETWKEALAVCEQEFRRALEHGFTTDELTEVVKDLSRSVDNAVERETTRASASWLGEILAAAESGAVPANAATKRDLYQEALKTLTTAMCQDMLKRAWNAGTLVIGASGPVDLGPDASKTLEDLYKTSAAVPVEARKETAVAAWAYPSDPAKTGKIAARVHDDEFDVHTIAFDNGVRLFVKKTDFKQKQVLASVQVAQGRLDLVPAQYPLAWTADHVVDDCGLTAHSVDDLRKLFAGQDVDVRYRMVTEHFELAGPTTPKDLATECQWLCAQLMHAGWREEGLRELRKQLPLYYESLDHQLSGPLQTAFIKELYSGDTTRGIPPRADVEAVELDKVRAWLEPLLRTGALDVVLVGDLDVEEAVKAVAQTFGTLSPRKALDKREDRRTPARIATGLRRRYEVDTQDDKALVWIVFPATDGRDLDTKRALRFLAGTISDHLIAEIREKLGDAYSPDASAATSDAIPGDGYIAINVTVDPAHVDAIVDSALEITDELATDGPSAEEIDRLRTPALNQLRDARRQNAYWWNALVRTHSRTNVFDELRTEEEWLKKVSADDLAPFAKKYLKKERACVAIVVPKAKAKDADAADPATPKKND